jgi:hypothetical protein
MFEIFEQWTLYEKLALIIAIIGVVGVVPVSKLAYDYAKRRKEKKEYEKIMKDPVEVHFFIPREKTFEVGYAKQDSRVQPLDELEIPRGMEDVIFLRMRPKIDLKVRDIYFGFLIKETRKKPEISYSNAFMKESTFERKWYKDWHGHLHFPGERFWYKNETYVFALNIRTYEKGDYPFFMFFALSCNEYKSIKEEKHTHLKKKLKIKVKQKNI